MQVQIPYGSSCFEATLPAHTQVLSVREPESLIDSQRFSTLVSDFLGSNHCNLKDTIIVIADKTRVCGYPETLPLLVTVLKEYGLCEENLRFIVGYGTHARQSDDECLACYGQMYTQYPFIHHDCNDTSQFITYGNTQRGTPIRIRRDLVNASCVITMGPICHHYFAGYGGGRKLIFPGCGERLAIFTNHGLFLDKHQGVLSSCCQPGVLKGNPIATDLFEIEQQKRADMAIHGIMNSEGQLADVVVGSSSEDYIRACDIHAALSEVESPQVPLVIASCGGSPKDINFIQSHKAVHNSAMFVEDGGTLVMYCQCHEGIGSTTFLPWFKEGSFSAAFNRLSRGYEGNGGTALATMSKSKRIRICLVTELGEEQCRIMGVLKWTHEQATELIHHHTANIAFIANGSLLVRRTSG